MRKVANILCLLEIVLVILLPLVAWVYNVLGMDVENPFSADAIRWLFTHLSIILIPKHIAILVLLLTALGAMQYVGFFGFKSKTDEQDDYDNANQQGISQDLRRKKIRQSRWICLGLFLVMMVLLFLPVVANVASLLSITGTLLPSPWLDGFPLMFCFAVIFTALVYAVLTSSLGGLMGIARMLSYGLSNHGIWVVCAMMGGFVYNSFTYFF